MICIRQQHINNNNHIYLSIQTIGEEGPDSFYTGTLAKSLIKTLSDLGSPMAMSDMKKYTALADFDVVKTKYSGIVPTQIPIISNCLSIPGLYGDLNLGFSQILDLSLVMGCRFIYGIRCIGHPLLSFKVCVQKRPEISINIL